MNKKVLIVSDVPMSNSGVGNQCRHICKKLHQDGFEVIVIGVSNLNPLPPPTIHKFDSGEQIKIIFSNVFDDMNMITKVITAEKPDCLVLFTDPHQFSNIWIHANTVRCKIPIYYVHVWDTHLSTSSSGKPHYNLPIYENCDGIGCISRQTEWFVNETFTKAKYTSKPYIHYVGHGSDTSVYKLIPEEDFADTRDKLFNGRKYDFVVSMLGRNQLRKKFPNLLEAWRLFTDSLSEESKAKCALVLHTEVVSPIGFNILEVTDALAPNHNVHLSLGKESETVLNNLYNLSDVVVNISNAEGFGLTTNEAMLVGKPIIANMTGGLIDQVGMFKDGIPVNFTLEYKNHIKELGYGIWAYPLYPERTIIGNPGNAQKPGTHYLYDENCSIDDVVKGLEYWYSKTKEERAAMGKKGHDWCLERGLTAKSFASTVTKGIQHTIANFKPQPQFKLYNTK